MIGITRIALRRRISGRNGSIQDVMHSHLNHVLPQPQQCNYRMFVHYWRSSTCGVGCTYTPAPTFDENDKTICTTQGTARKLSADVYEPDMLESRPKSTRLHERMSVQLRMVL